MKAYWGKARIGVVALLAVAAFAILAVASRAMLHAQLATSPWPMFLHDPAHTGLSPYDTSANNGSLKWKFATSGSVGVLTGDRQ